jgi:hypothetical protein
MVAGIVFAAIATLIIEEAEAQQQLQRSMITGTISPTAQQIIDAVKAECAKTVSLDTLPGGEPVSPELNDVFVDECLFLLYESATTVVLNGDLLIRSSPGLYIDNPFIWQAVDEFKVQGYKVDSVMVSGQGSQGNPHELYVVMSK